MSNRVGIELPRTRYCRYVHITDLISKQCLHKWRLNLLSGINYIDYYECCRNARLLLKLFHWGQNSVCDCYHHHRLKKIEFFYKIYFWLECVKGKSTTKNKILSRNVFKFYNNVLYLCHCLFIAKHHVTSSHEQMW